MSSVDFSHEELLILLILCRNECEKPGTFMEMNELRRQFNELTPHATGVSFAQARERADESISKLVCHGHLHVNGHNVALACKDHDDKDHDDGETFAVTIFLRAHPLVRLVLASQRLLETRFPSHDGI